MARFWRWFNEPVQQPRAYFYLAAVFSLLALVEVVSWLV